MTSPLTLADRCEAASGADRELDAEIAVALDIGARGLLPSDFEYLARVRKDDGCAPGTYWFKCRSGKSLRTAEAYTASLDAAMTLVPEGWRWSIHNAGWAGMQPPSDDLDEPGPDLSRWCGNTPALALCAAALRARAQKEPNDGQ